MDTTTSITTRLPALRLSEERECARYLAARKAMTAASKRAASLRQLVTEHPRRGDYRQAYLAAVEDFRAALVRTENAHTTYVHAQRRSDAAWTATEGRLPISDRRAA